MNKRLVFKTLGKILTMEAGFMVLPILLGLYYRESWVLIRSFLASLVLVWVLGMSLSAIRTEKDLAFNIKDGYGLVSLSWLALSFFGALPFFLSGVIPNLVDAIFESTSGFTATGASVLTQLEGFPRSMHFWRSFTQFIGGMGVLVFALSLMSQDTKGSLNIMRAEVPGPEAGKVVSKVGPTAKILYGIYLSMTLVTTCLLLLAGMGFFDALIHAMGAISTGGFSNKTSSLAHYNSVPINIIVSIAMFLSGINFNLFYFILIGKIKNVKESEELRFYTKIIIFTIIFISILTLTRFIDTGHHISDIVLTVVSVTTSTGFTTVDFSQWPMATNVVLLFLMFTGGCAGSTAGGLKMKRVMTLAKTGFREIKKAVNPRRVLTIKESNRHISDVELDSTQSYLTIYIMVFAVVLFLVSLEIQDFDSAFSATLTALNNASPTFAAVGPGDSFDKFSSLTKLVLSFTMILGRLEIIPILLLFSPGTWQKK